MIAALPMYDLPALRQDTDDLWQAIRDALGFGPARLTRDADLWEVWQSPDLLLAQTCGLPYRARLHGQVMLVGTPDYQLPGCPPGFYNSVLIARGDDRRQSFDGTRLAYNEALSQSGWAAPQAHGLRPGALVQTGSHAASAEAVANIDADIAAIDAQTYRLLQEHAPSLMSQLRDVDRTAPTPGLPFVTGMPEHLPALRAAIKSALRTLPAETLARLHLHDLVLIDSTDYLSQPLPTPPNAPAQNTDT